ncbi:MAG: alpha/beta fold hydrolase [Pseudonocardiaceae bacterium]
MSLLQVPGARLYYETRGSGPALLMIPGASGNARIFTAVAESLAEHHTVVTYDRRGFSRSSLDGPQDYDHRLATDADDVHRLIEHLGAAPAAVFGTSSGAVVALTVLARHPSAVCALAAYEPAAVWLLPDGQSWLDFIGRLYDLYRNRGVVPALAEFREQVLTAGDRQLLAQSVDPGSGEHLHANATHWFERELLQYSAIIETPGGHAAAGTHPAEFGRTLQHALSTCGADDPRPGSDGIPVRR